MMVGLFSRLSVGSSTTDGGIHRRTQSSLDERGRLPPITEATVTANAATATSHGIEVAVEFKPVEQPIQPLDSDTPVQCPLPEPSILHDGRIWKERASATMRRRPDLPIMKEGTTLESEGPGTKPRTSHSNRMILPSLSAPEHNILKLLEECNASGI